MTEVIYFLDWKTAATEQWGGHLDQLAGPLNQELIEQLAQAPPPVFAAALIEWMAHGDLHQAAIAARITREFNPDVEPTIYQFFGVDGASLLLEEDLEGYPRSPAEFPGGILLME